jgi:predicted O-methyltransferase YrrM
MTVDSSPAPHDARWRAAIPPGAQFAAGFLDTLRDMYLAETLEGADGGRVTLDRDTRITVAQGFQINRLVREGDVRRTLEIGFAYGFSTAWIMEALSGRDGAAHAAVDPFEKTMWGGVGLAQLPRFGFSARFDWIEKYSIVALPQLIEAGEKFDLIYIDGNHRFDDVLVDFYLADFLVPPGGTIVLDDMWMPSIRTATNFILANRRYAVVDQPVRNMIALRKGGDDDRDWRHFTPFTVHDPESLAARIERAGKSARRAAARLLGRRG